MNIFKTFVAGAAMAITLPAAAQTTINFDQLPNGTTLPSSGTTISTQYASEGVTFLGTNTANGNTGPLNAWGLLAATGPGGSGNYLGNFGAITPSAPVPGPSDYLLAPRYNVTSLLFANVVSDISFGLYTGGGQNSVTINAYDAGGVQLQSLVGVMANQGRFDIQTLSASGVAKIDIIGGFNFGSTTVRLYGIDNLNFTVDPIVTPVPEAATWAMLLLGFGMTGAAVRGRKTRTVAAA
jgi:hypothetical protein